MVHVYRLTAGLLLYLALIYSCRDNRSAVATNLATPRPQPASFAELFPAEGFTPEQKQAYREGLAERKLQLEEMQSAQEQMEKAAEERPAYLARLARAVEEPWAELIQTNLTRFLELKGMAAASPRGEVACDICDGHSYMPCLLCQGGQKCQECGGRGSRGSNTICPACLGRAKCALCSGFGKMLCPFCNDGMIGQDQGPPRAHSWLE